MALTPRQELYAESIRAISDRQRSIVLGQVIVAVAALASMSAKFSAATKVADAIQRIMTEVNDIGVAIEFLEGERNGSVS